MLLALFSFRIFVFYVFSIYQTLLSYKQVILLKLGNQLSKKLYIVKYYQLLSQIRLVNKLKVLLTSIYYIYIATIYYYLFYYLLFNIESQISSSIITFLLYIKSYSTFYSILIFYNCLYLPIVRVYSYYTYTDFLCSNISNLHKKNYSSFTFG